MAGNETENGTGHDDDNYNHEKAPRTLFFIFVALTAGRKLPQGNAFLASYAQFNQLNHKHYT